MIRKIMNDTDFYNKIRKIMNEAEEKSSVSLRQLYVTGKGTQTFDEMFNDIINDDDHDHAQVRLIPNTLLEQSTERIQKHEKHKVNICPIETQLQKMKDEVEESDVPGMKFIDRDHYL